MTETPSIERQLSRVEERIEANIRHHSSPPKSKLQKFRATGSVLAHSKAVLMTVVLLNCIDCILVLSELLLDVYFISSMIVTAEETMETFNGIMKEKYPVLFAGIALEDTHSFYNRILQTTLLVNRTMPLYNNSNTEYLHTVSGSDPVRVVHVAGGLNQPLFDDQDDPAFLDERSDSTEELLSTVFHKTSIVILGLLFVFILFKAFCGGWHFLKHKLEVFDALVVISSLTLDLCYIRGLTNYRAESFVLILVIMIPWRVIRVLNSLVIAVKDNYYFLLKLMYKRHKQYRTTIGELQEQSANTQNVIKSLTQLCQDVGVSMVDLQNVLDQYTFKAGSVEPNSDMNVDFINYPKNFEIEVHVSKSETIPLSSTNREKILQRLFFYL